MEHYQHISNSQLKDKQIIINTSNISKKKKKQKRTKISIDPATTPELLQNNTPKDNKKKEIKPVAFKETVQEKQKLIVIEDDYDCKYDDYDHKYDDYDYDNDFTDADTATTVKSTQKTNKTVINSQGKRPAVIDAGDIVPNIGDVKKKKNLDSKKSKVLVTENTVVEEYEVFTPFKPFKNANTGLTAVVAVDCEMVMTVGNNHELARCSIVNYDGHVLFDKLIYPKNRITNYLTWVSGITPAKLKGAKPYEAYKDEIMEILKGRTIVGHSLKNDFEALNYFPQDKSTRDLAYFRKLRDSGKLLSLKKMISTHLNINFQDGSHDSVEDARAAMAIYRKFEQQWEEDIKQANYGQVRNQFLSDLKNAFL